MTDHNLAQALAGMTERCPRCDALPGEPCQDPRTGRTRATTHRERKQETT